MSFAVELEQNLPSVLPHPFVRCFALSDEVHRSTNTHVTTPHPRQHFLPTTSLSNDCFNGGGWEWFECTWHWEVTSRAHDGKIFGASLEGESLGSYVSFSCHIGSFVNEVCPLVMGFLPQYKVFWVMGHMYLYTYKEWSCDMWVRNKGEGHEHVC